MAEIELARSRSTLTELVANPFSAHAVSSEPHRGLELTVLGLANAVSTLVRFLSQRQLIGRRRE